jgi:hypothetical protein
VRHHLEAYFPNLLDARFRETSPQDTFYNCIAFAAGDTSRKWWPNHAPGAYWPVDREETVANFEKAFETLGYKRCEDEHLEAGFEKVALYADRGGDPTHMARQLPSGFWTSKLGDLEDIEHETLEQLNGTHYGRPVAFFKRSTP